jgi:hypothetical protein
MRPGPADGVTGVAAAGTGGGVCADAAPMAASVSCAASTYDLDENIERRFYIA